MKETFKLGNSTTYDEQKPRWEMSNKNNSRLCLTVKSVSIHHVYLNIYPVTIFYCSLLIKSAKKEKTNFFVERSRNLLTFIVTTFGEQKLKQEEELNGFV